MTDFQINDNDTEGKVHFNLFNKEIDFVVEDNDSIEYAKKCVKYLNKIEKEIVIKLCNASIRYYNYVLKQLGNTVKFFESPMDVLTQIDPVLLIIPALEDNSDPIIHLELNCDWEAEHGMEWIIREGNILYVGPFSGEDPLEFFTDEIAWNFA